MTVAALLVTIVLLWGACLLSIAWLAWTDLPEDLGRVEPGTLRRLQERDK